MATYKAEFLAHYYEKHRRPRSAFAFGLIHRWARLAALAPRLVNFVTQTRGSRTLARMVSGMAPQRRVPAFAPMPFLTWYKRRPARPHGTGGRVLLWPDTFNNFFHPETAIAAVHVLERAGFEVEVPRGSVCCGRPLYDYGMLEAARDRLEHVLATLAPEIEAGVPIVGLEPSCVAVFRDEMHGLLPDREDAKRLARQVFTLSEFLNDRGFHYPTLRRHALVHGHCHHKAVMKMDAEERALRAMALDVTMLDSGCCGMAGSFGFERAHYDISMKVGELVLLPAVRQAAKDTLIVADGFSCRTQIAQATDRRALHLADLLEMASRDGGPGGEYPERAYVPDHGAVSGVGRPILIAATLIGATIGAAVWFASRRDGRDARAATTS
jgi:Fe-S oxidoreductase